MKSLYAKSTTTLLPFFSASLTIVSDAECPSVTLHRAYRLLLWISSSSSRIAVSPAELTNQYVWRRCDEHTAVHQPPESKSKRPKQYSKEGSELMNSHKSAQIFLTSHSFRRCQCVWREWERIKSAAAMSWNALRGYLWPTTYTNMDSCAIKIVTVHWMQSGQCWRSALTKMASSCVRLLLLDFNSTFNTISKLLLLITATSATGSWTFFTHH